MKKTHVILILSALLLVSGCESDHQQQALLYRADSLMSVSPAQALGYTDSLMSTGEGGGHFQSQLHLRRLNAKNKLDTVFTSRHVDEAKTLVEHFDRHGTPNERMLAHYLLGRTYADTHEAPMALEAYQDAVSCADTTAADCDYGSLMRIHGQMATLFLTQDAPQNAIEQMSKIDKYARLLKDTLMILINQEQLSGAYHQLNEPDSEIIIRERVSQQYALLGYTKMAARALGPTIDNLMDKGDYAKAKKYLRIFEEQSGTVDANHHCIIEPKTYYYYKGMLLLEERKLDSAEYYFRKEIKEAILINDLEAGYKGLSILYQKNHLSDSAAKYALLAYEINDSSYRMSATGYYQKMQSLYNYTRNQQIAEQKTQENEKLRFILTITTLVIVCSLFVIYLTVNAYKKKRFEIKKNQEKFHEKYMAFKQSEAELSLLVAEKEKALSAIVQDRIEKQQQIDSLSNQITRLEYTKKELVSLLTEKDFQIKETEKEKTLSENEKVQLTSMVKLLNEQISSLTREKALFNEQLMNKDIQMSKAEIYWKQSIDEKQIIIKEQEQQIILLQNDANLRKLANMENELLGAEITATFKDAIIKKGQNIKLEHWSELRSLIQTHVPHFFPTIMNEYPQIRDEELKICMLIRLNFPMKHIANLLGITLQNLNNIRRRLHVKIFHQVGAAKDFDLKIHQIR